MTRNAQTIAHLEAGGLVLTPGLRQARIVRRLHDRAQLAAGKRVWPSAQVLPLDTWLQDLWREAGAVRDDLPSLLALPALAWLWRHEAAQDISGLLDARSLGARARQSWLTLRAHLGSLADVTRFPLTRDQQAFVTWARGVEAALRERNACDAEDLATLLVERDALPAPGAPLLLAGFRHLTPAQAALAAALRHRGWPVTRLEADDESGSVHCHAAPDPDAELAAAIAWIRSRFDGEPEGLHAVVVPELESRRGVLERRLLASLQPQLELPDSAQAPRVFDLAAGPALAMQPVVESALDAIAIAVEPPDWARQSRLLRSPYVAAAAGEADIRVRADVEMRCLAGGAAGPPTVLAASCERRGAARFAESVRAAAGAVAGAPRRTASVWAESFGNCLAAWRWPGDHLSSREFQAARHFRECLRELATSAQCAPELDAGSALNELRSFASVPFQPESGEPSVFVLDAYDDPGVRVDSLWIAGLTAAAWPRPVTVDPMLPIEIQRRLRMPRVTADDCVAEASEILAAWRAASAELVLSWPRRDNDTETDGSPLLPNDAEPLGALAGVVVTREQLAWSAARLEPVPDVALPAIRGRAQGGARVVELQSHCPFRAFGELRLHAAALEEPQAGVDRRLRGIVLHRALQRLWSEWGSQRVLRALAPAVRDAKVRAAVEESLAHVLADGCGARTLALERDWQCRAISRLLALDVARAPFTVVETERSLTGRIGGLELGLRVDRVDRVGDALVVIDYKSGRVRKSPWHGARMEAPQLPLYAVLHPARPAAIAIAEIGAYRAAYRGVASDDGILDTLALAVDFELDEERGAGFSWDRIREHWYAWLERLAADHALGRVEVDPKLGGETCRTCHLSALCRVSAALIDESDENGDAE